MSDINSLDRFVEAQTLAYPTALAEIRRGAKRSHWMWFVFPQIAGLGRSDMARRYAIRDLSEAAAYLAHPVLGQRLRETTALMLTCNGASAVEILGSPDDLKFRSSLTLFRTAATSPEDVTLSQSGLDRYFKGAPDPTTLSILAAQTQ